ncbi:ThuA domain-containing protein [Pontibacter sp. E15-1]|uniref:ThuA domain-containing protein n=1 Tax=Pontibacter sp. E15-1 TaxID=2919918 RepID=UPI001F4FDF6E|nr:ThuA domain-containing protein [Pontibacter sp. E15-1]MCJ8165310.1 ThuA domain-containing protein [Pontibacter sp. E15-1]
MKKELLHYGAALLLFCGAQACSSSASETRNPAAAEVQKADASRILVFSKTSGYYHESIPDGIAAIQKLGGAHTIVVDTTKNAAYFTPDSLRHYKAVVFLSTTQDVLDPAQQEAFTKYIQNGGGFAGIHAAADTEYDWPWYNKLVGAYFLSHPKQQQATVRVKDKNHPSTSHLPDNWERFDELYNYKDINPDIKVLATLDESTYEGGKNGENHPIVWYHDFDGGRSFYTGLGHTKESYTDSTFLQHMWGGISYAMGEE